MSNHREFPKFLSTSPKIFGVNVWAVFGSLFLMGVLVMLTVRFEWAVGSSLSLLLGFLVAERVVERKYVIHFLRKGKRVRLYGRYR
jgi:hypothetical protein